MIHRTGYFLSLHCSAYLSRIGISQFFHSLSGSPPCRFSSPPLRQPKGTVKTRVKIKHNAVSPVLPDDPSDWAGRGGRQAFFWLALRPTQASLRDQENEDVEQVWIWNTRRSRQQYVYNSLTTENDPGKVFVDHSAGVGAVPTPHEAKEARDAHAQVETKHVAFRSLVPQQLIFKVFDTLAKSEARLSAA